MRTALLLAATALAALIPARGADAPPAPAGCVCHDALDPLQTAHGIDLRGWNHDGVHLKQGCTACHPGSDKVPHAGKPGVTPCASCHAAEAAGASEDVHGRVDGKKPQVRGCQTCHAEHTFFHTTDIRSRYLPSGLAHSCAACHQPRLVDPLMTLPVKPAPPGKSWPAGPHGFAVTNEERKVTQCQSCHGSHGIFPASDKRSAVHRDNLKETCGRCHEGVDPEKIIGRVCYKAGEKSWALRNYFEVWYLWGGGIAGATVGGLVLAFIVESVVRRRKRESGESTRKG